MGLPLLFFVVLLLGCLPLGGCSNSDELEPIPPEEMLSIVAELGSYDRDVQETAFKTIRVNPREPTVAALREILNTGLGNFDLRVRVHIALLLATWPDENNNVDKAGLPDLLEALRSPNDHLRRKAESVLPLFGRAAVRPVADILSSGQKSNRMSAVTVLGNILRDKQDPQAAQALQEVLREEKEAEVRIYVLIKYAQWASRDVVEGLLIGLTDPNEDIREYAWKELARKKPPHTFDPFDAPAKRATVIQQLGAWWSTQKGKHSRR